jgi:hypothetical protein
MGLFDTIIVEKALPLPKKAKEAFKGKDWGKVDFQTKDLEECMQTYYLKKNGDLILEKIEGDYEELSEEELKEAKQKYSPGYYPAIKFTETGRSLVKQKITQSVNFYTGRDDNEGNQWWLEFVAVFDGGKLSSLKAHKVELTRTAAEVKRANDEFRARLEADRNHPWNKTRKALNKASFGYWAATWRFIAKTSRKAGQGLDKLGFWIFRNM